MSDDLEALTGDRAGAASLRRAMRALADYHAGTPLAREIDAVLAGRQSIRDLAADPEFATLAHEGMVQFQEDWRKMSAEERDSLVSDGMRYGAALDQERSS
jgi:hypothetical protein